MLAGLSDEEIRRKRERLRDVHRMFVWDGRMVVHTKPREQVQARLRLTGWLDPMSSWRRIRLEPRRRRSLGELWDSPRHVSRL